MPWPIRRTKLRAPASVFNPRVRPAQGLKRARKTPLPVPPTARAPAGRDRSAAGPAVHPSVPEPRPPSGGRRRWTAKSRPLRPPRQGRLRVGTRLGPTASTSRHNMAIPTLQPSKARIRGRGRLRTRTLCMYRLATHSWKHGRRWREVTPRRPGIDAVAASASGTATEQAAGNIGQGRLASGTNINEIETVPSLKKCIDYLSVFTLS